MKQINMTYAKAESCFYEAMRINKGNASEWSALKEGNALIDVARTRMNYELIPHHAALNPSDYSKHHRGQGIADYHKKVTGRAARMKGDEEQRSKAVGCIITLPKDYLGIDYGLTEEEYKAIEMHVESMSDNEPKSAEYESAMKKINNHKFSAKELEAVEKFFRSALKAWQLNAGVRDEDMLYAVVHMDESYPHLHIMALPTVEKEAVDKETGEITKKVTFSTDKFNNRKTHYFDHLHENIIKLMAEDGIDASGLLNGATRNKGFNPGDFNHTQRAEGVELARQSRALREEIKREEIKKTETKNYIDKIIRDAKKKVKKVKRREERLDKRETVLNLGEEKLNKRTSEFNEIVKRNVKNKVTEILIKRLNDIFDIFGRLFKGKGKHKHQKRLIEEMSKLPLPKDFKVDDIDYGGKTIGMALQEAKMQDMRDALEEESELHSNEDIKNAKSILESGNSISEIAEAIAAEIEEEYLK